MRSRFPIHPRAPYSFPVGGFVRAMPQSLHPDPRPCCTRENRESSQQAEIVVVERPSKTGISSAVAARHRRRRGTTYCNGEPSTLKFRLTPADAGIQSLSPHLSRCPSLKPLSSGPLFRKIPCSPSPVSPTSLSPWAETPAFAAPSCLSPKVESRADAALASQAAAAPVP